MLNSLTDLRDIRWMPQPESRSRYKQHLIRSDQFVLDSSLIDSQQSLLNCFPKLQVLAATDSRTDLIGAFYLRAMEMNILLKIILLKD